MSAAQKSPKGQARVEEILDAATEILTQDGYGEFSMRRVAERLGLRLSNVQYYFDGPSDLLSSLFDRAMSKSIEAFEASSRSDELEDAVHFLLEEQLGQEYCILIWELWALAAKDPSLNHVMIHFYDRYRALVESVLQRANPDLNPTQRRQKALILVSLFEGLSLFRSDQERLQVFRKPLDREILKTVRQIALSVD